ncbi:MAG: transporter substrate-binding domain-containing protein [Clostridia bacterium]|nr:transporter substrate-binding domain-containing protein [Clostridia bacterium]
MKKILAIMLALTFIFALSACGEIEGSDKEYITEKGELVVGITYFAPMNYLDDDNKLTGFETDFATAVCEELGLKVKFQEISWDAKETELSSKNIDCIWNGMTITEEREANMSISQPYMQNKQVLVMKKDAAEKIKSSDDLKDMTIVAEKESAGEKVVNSDGYFTGVSYVAVDTQAKALTEVKSGTADGAVVDYVASIGMIGEGTDYEELVVVGGASFSPEEYGIAFRKGSDMTAEVNKAINKLIASGKLEEIAAKYKLEEQIIKG